MADWTVDQITVVASVVAAQDWRPLLRSDPRLPALSRLLSAFPAKDGAGPASRNSNAVRMKSDDLVSLLPTSGRALRRGASRDTREVLARFLDDPSTMHTVAANLAARYADTAIISPGERTRLGPLLRAPDRPANSLPATAPPVELGATEEVPVATATLPSPDELLAAETVDGEALAAYGEQVRVVATLLGLPRARSSGTLPPRAFLNAVASQLDVSLDESSPLELLVRCAEAATLKTRYELGVSTSQTPALVALLELVRGLTLHGPTGEGPVLPGGELDHLDEGLPEPGESPLVTDQTSRAEDERRRRVVETVARDGQSRFRAALVRAYGGRCAVTGADALDALDAAHVLPYKGPRTNAVDNGLLLRTDVHRLFDRGLLAVDPDSLKVLLSEELLASTYGDLAGRAVREPRRQGDRVNRDALSRHLRWTGLKRQAPMLP